MKYHIQSLPLILIISFSFRITPGGAPVILYAGTPVYLSLNQTVSSEEVEVGHTVEYLVRSDVTVNGKVLVATGSIAEGRVTKVVKSCGGRCHQRCAELTIVPESVQAVDGQRIHLRSIPFEVKGDCFSDSPAIAKLGSAVSTRILNNIKINA